MIALALIWLVQRRASRDISFADRVLDAVEAVHPTILFDNVRMRERRVEEARASGCCCHWSHGRVYQASGACPTHGGLL